MELPEWLATLAGAAAGVAVITGFLVAVLKTALGDALPTRYYPLTSIAVGIIVALVVVWSLPLAPFTAREAPLVGALAGGLASGLFQYGKGRELKLPPHG